MLTAPQRWRRTAGTEVVERAVGGQTLLVPIRSSPTQKVNIFTLNETGGFVWTALRESATASHLAHSVAEEFEVTLSQAQADVRAFLDALGGLGLVEVVPT